MYAIGFLPDTSNCGLCMRRECRDRFPRHWLQRKPLFSDPSMHHDTYVTHVPWCMSGSLNRSGGENVPGIPGACATSNLTYLTRGRWVWLASPQFLFFSNHKNKKKHMYIYPFPHPTMSQNVYRNKVDNVYKSSWSNKSENTLIYSYAKSVDVIQNVTPMLSYISHPSTYIVLADNLRFLEKITIT